MSMMTEFKEPSIKVDTVDLAVDVLIGAMFGNIVSSLE